MSMSKRGFELGTNEESDSLRKLQVTVSNEEDGNSENLDALEGLSPEAGVTPDAAVTPEAVDNDGHDVCASNFGSEKKGVMAKVLEQEYAQGNKCDKRGQMQPLYLTLNRWRSQQIEYSSSESLPDLCGDKVDADGERGKRSNGFQDDGIASDRSGSSTQFVLSSEGLTRDLAQCLSFGCVDPVFVVVLVPSCSIYPLESSLRILDFFKKSSNGQSELWPGPSTSGEPWGRHRASSTMLEGDGTCDEFLSQQMKDKEEKRGKRKRPYPFGPKRPAK